MDRINRIKVYKMVPTTENLKRIDTIWDFCTKRDQTCNFVR